MTKYALYAPLQAKPGKRNRKLSTFCVALNHVPPNVRYWG